MILCSNIVKRNLSTLNRNYHLPRTPSALRWTNERWGQWRDAPHQGWWQATEGNTDVSFTASMCICTGLKCRHTCKEKSVYNEAVKIPINSLLFLEST